MDPSITQVIVFHRSIGSADESASDEEQANKILFYYPEDVPITEQVDIQSHHTQFHGNCS